MGLPTPTMGADRVPGGLDVSIRRSGRVMHLCVGGELDTATGPALGTTVSSALAAAPHVQRVEIDLRGVQFVDVAGLRSLLRLRRTGRARVVLLSPPEHLRRLLRYLLRPRHPQ